MENLERYFREVQFVFQISINREAILVLRIILKKQLKEGKETYNNAKTIVDMEKAFNIDSSKVFEIVKSWNKILW